ncbi:MAG: molybdate ABC transporter substrate-binding protein [Deltaproteobacteria bacterium]|nr:molybdate ABC transporter substrate-binding protein [Candidatus Tharpellaceae bacterium]
MKKLLVLLLLSLIFFACSRETSEKSLLIMCGSANRPPMREIADLYEQETGIKVHLLYGSGGGLLSQIELTRKGDIYLPGSPDYIIKARNKHLIFPDSTQQICYLIPAIITPKGNPKGIKTLQDLGKDGIKVGIGNPDTVCMGLYAIELLEKNNLLKQVMRNVVVYGGSCSKTANLAALNKVDAIVGWRVLHFWNPDKMDFIPIKKKALPRISYIPISIPIYTRDKKESQRFIDFVISEKGKQIYRKWGYVADRTIALSFAEQATIGGECILPEEYFQLIRQR